MSEIYTVSACRGGRNAGTAVARISSAEEEESFFLKAFETRQGQAFGLVRKGNKKKKKDPNFPFSLVFWQRPSSKDLRVSPTQQFTQEKERGETEMKKIS